MSVVRCSRCDRLIDTDFKLEEVVTIDEVDILDVENETDFVCVNCLSNREQAVYYNEPDTYVGSLQEKLENERSDFHV